MSNPGGSPNRSTSPNVYGIETEYSCTVTLPDDGVSEIVGKCHSEDARIGLYEQPKNRPTSGIDPSDMNDALIEMGIYRNSLFFLSNGGRFYIDPSGPEYDTPETTTAEEAVVRSFEGDLVIVGIFRNLQKRELIKSFQVNRRIVDHNRTSRGIHLNTQTKLSNRMPNDQVIDWLATLNTAKGAMFGSGGLLLNRKGKTAYHHSPRLSLTNQVADSYANYSSRPLVRYPFKAEGDNLSRIETVTSDALNFGWPMRASLVATNALIGVIELGYGDRLPRIANTKHAAHEVGRRGSEAVVYVHGDKELRKTKPLEVIRDICEVVFGVDDKEGQLDKESHQVLGEIIEAADKMSNDQRSVANQVESVGRLVAMERRMEQYGVDLDSERMCRFDYAWDWIGASGIAETLRNRGSVGWQGFSRVPTVVAQKRDLVKPPQDTRAKLRGARILETQGQDSSTWDQFDDGRRKHYLDPLTISFK